jgi:hypothetical protein
VSSRETGPTIPLTDLAAHGSASAETSVGDLVREASVHVSTLIRSEIALAKSELVQDGKRAAVSAAFVIAALVILLYSSFFFFFFLGWLLMEWLPGWAAFGIVFLLMVGAAVGIGVLGYLVVRRISGPKKTIQSVKDLETLIPKRPQTAPAEAPTT